MTTETKPVDSTAWLVVDPENGWLDGYYTDQADAWANAEAWATDLGRPMLVAMVMPGQDTPGIGPCFMADKRALQNIAATAGTGS